MLRVLNDILCSADKGDFVLLVLLDLSAAFDTIDHSILLKRPQDEVGITDVAYQQLQSHPADSYQFLQLNMASLDSSHLTCGVLQGSELRPILFFLFTVQSGKTVDKYKVGQQFFANDSGLHNNFQPNQAAATVSGSESWELL